MVLNVKLRSVFLFAMVAVVCLVAATYAVVAYHIRKTDVIQDANVKLLTAGHLARMLAGSGYHERIVDQTSLSKEDFDRVVARNDELCLSMGLQYVWSLMEFGDRIVFTTATHSVLTNQNSDCARFFDVHTNPDAYRHVFATMQPEFAMFHDKWGEGRMVLLPAWDQKHRKYLFAASIQLADFDAVLRRTLRESIALSLLIATIFSLLALGVSRLLTRPLTRLTGAIERMGKGELDGDLPREGLQELATLADSFENMRRTVQQQMEVLRENEERFRLTFEHAAIGIGHVALDGRFLRVNERFSSITGYTQDEMLARTFQDITHPDDLEADLEQVRQMLAGKSQTYSMEKRYLRKDGTIVWVSLTVALLREASGAPQYFIGTVVDITERQRITETLRQSQASLSAITESSRDFIFSVDAKSLGLLHFNSAFACEVEKSYGVQARLGMTGRDVLPPKFWPLWESLIQRALKEGSYRMEYLRPADQKYFDVSFSLIQNGPQVTGVAVFIRDITVSKQAEEALRANEIKMRILFNILPVGISIVDGEQRLVSMNPELSRLLGLPEEDLKRGVYAQRRYLRGDGTPMPPEEFPSTRAIREGCEVRNVELGVVKEDGATRWVLVSATPLPGGGAAIATRDITERKQAEASLLASEYRLRAFLDNSAVIAWMKDGDGRHVFVSDNFLRRFQTRREDRIGKTDLEIWPRSVAEELQRNDQQVRDSGHALEIIEQVSNPDGSLSWWLVSKFLFVDTDGKRYVGGVGVDITEREQALAQLRESEERYRLLAENTEDFVSVHDREEHRLYISPSYYRATGWTPADLDGSPWDARLHPDDLPVILRSRAANRVGQNALIEHRIRCRNGSWLWVEARSKPVMKADGQFERLVIWSHDITARKAAEDALRDSQAHLTAVLESTEDLVWSMNANTLDILSYNIAFADDVFCTYGVRVRPGLNLREVLPADRIPHFEELLQWAIREGRYTDEFFRPNHPKYFERTFNPIVKAGQTVSVAIFARDITARKRAEVALRESEGKFTRLAEHLEDVLYSVDAETREFRYVSPAFTRLFGYTPEDIQHMGGRRAFLKQIIQGGRFIQQDSNLDLLVGQPSSMGAHLEAWWLCKDGTLRYVQDSWVPVFENGKLISTEGLLSDITKAKLAENKLRESEAQLKEAQRLAKLGSWNWDVVTDTVIWSDELYALWGLDQQPVPPSLAPYMQHFLPKTLPHQPSALQQATPTGEDYEFETEFQRVDGTSGYLLIHGTSQREKDGRIVRLYGTAQDITERKRMEQQILDISEREQRRIGQDLHDGVGQQITALRFLTSALRQKMLEQKPMGAEGFDRLDSMLAATIKQVRGLAHGLYPVNADSQGLMHSLRELCRTMQPVFGVPCAFTCEAPVLISDPTAALNLYRIAQEALHNAAAHGAPQHIWLQLTRLDGRVRLVVTDDGRGLPREKKHKERKGMGLEIMRYRAQAIGATLAFASEPGAGVMITCEWPDKQSKEQS